MNRTDRLYALVEELRAVAPQPRSAAWLAHRFEVSSRTIERDLSALQQSGVPIWAQNGRRGGYAIDASHTLAPLGFTVEEALAVTVGLGMLSGSPFRDAGASALRKVSAVMDERRLQRTAELARRVYLLEEIGEGEGAAPDTPAVRGEVLAAGRVLRLTYRDRAGERTVREVEPLGFVGRGGDWYLIAWCRLRNGVRAFRGDRIAEAEPTGERAPERMLSAGDLDIAYGHLRPVGRARGDGGETA
ncbi:WYL domain-containing protein [Herbiconiux sp.]|uniref:helix-turn-helix transcriptional regulator n=1 Tax=Herbiconiux sp. TaxID=1871186 RepID=UPI0025C6D762|nr:WYL domain-containing protein [Herbiconiux sp.]